MITKHAILFDLDGTLLDTGPGILEAVSHAIEELRLEPLSNQALLTFVGPPVQDSFKRHYGMDSDMAQRAAGVFREYYKDKSLLRANVYPGIVELLSALRRSGVKIAVATYKRHDYALTLLQSFGIAPLCDVIHGADDRNVLRKADIVSLCVSDLGLDVDACVLVGDTVYDAEGAAKMGMEFIGVGYGFGFKNPQEISMYPSVSFVGTVKELTEFLVGRS